MKTKILTILLLLFTLAVQAQVFPESNAIWSIQEDYLVGSFPEQELINNVRNYGLYGDTIINEITYNKLYLLNDTTISIDSRDEYLGGFRQEGKKVWFRPSFPPFYPLYDNRYDPPYPEETLLYDFSKNVGDTIWHNAISSSSYWEMRDSITASIITSINVDEQGREKYHTCQYVYNAHHKEFMPLGNCDSWIEGIGSVKYGLFWFLTDLPTCPCPVSHLNCFKQGNEVKYINNLKCNLCFCSTLTGVSTENNISLEIIHENNNVWIKGESSIFPCDLKLFSPVGQLILERRLQSDTEKIPVNQLKGIYLYQIQKNKETVKTGKIIIK